MIIKRHFNSLGEFLAKSQEKTSDEGDFARASRRSQDYGESFFKGSYESAVTLAEKGWPEGLRLAGKVLNNISATLQTKKPDFQTFYSHAGDFVDVARYLSGEPECMVTFETIEKPGNGIVTIEVGTAFHAGIRSDQVERRGAAIMALIDALESQGRQVNVIASIGEQSGDSKYFASVSLKSAGNLLPLDCLAFCLTHSDFFRRIGFGVMETENEETRRALSVTKWGGYGRPHNVKTSDCDLYLASDRFESFTSDDYAIKWVRDTLKTQGIETD